MHFYTSININYLPKARILAKSIRKYCKDARFSLVLSDVLPDDIKIKEEPFDEVITVYELGIPVKNLDLWVFEHTPVELCTAVKGQALVRFLEGGSEKVVYLDPDIAVFNHLHEMEQLLDQYDILLTPHLTIPEENNRDIRNNEICALQHGAYNFGFYAVKNSKNGLEFARWWRDRLMDFCVDDIPNGIFTDQKWGDLVPCMFDNVHIIRDVGYNVATWNISHRIMDKDKNGRYTVNGTLLKFYHFSGFDSGAQKRMLGIYSKGNQYLYELRNWYIKRLEEEGQETYGSYPSKYNFYDNGEKITDYERKLIRSRMDVTEYFKNVNPYVTQQEKSYYMWYRAEAGEHTENKTAEELMAELERIQSSRGWRILSFLKKIRMISIRK